MRSEHPQAGRWLQAEEEIRRAQEQAIDERLKSLSQPATLRPIRQRRSELPRRTHHFASGAFRVTAVASDGRPVSRTLAVRSAILAALCRCAVASRVRTFLNLLFNHKEPLALLSVRTSIRPPTPKINPHPRSAKDA